MDVRGQLEAQSCCALTAMKCDARALVACLGQVGATKICVSQDLESQLDRSLSFTYLIAFTAAHAAECHAVGLLEST